MIPLILLALGLGAALTVYELSPRTRSRVDSYLRAIRSADAAHQTADTHLVNASAAAVTAVSHAQQAGAVLQASPMPSPMQWVPTGPVQWMPTGPVQWMPMPEAPSTVPTVPMPEAAPTAAPAPVPAFPQDVADAHANASQAAVDAAVDQAAAATEANQSAAQNTADAAQNAQTEAEKQAAADSAAKVLEREQKIAAALRSLGVGQCGVRSYARVNERVKNALLARLRTEGMGVVGDNPWNINTRQYDVKLRAVWDPNAQVVKLIVTSGKGGYLGLVTCEEIWKKIDPIMRSVIDG